MKSLIIGSGGREYALGWVLKKFGSQVYFADGNGATLFLGKNLSFKYTDYQQITNFISENSIDLVVIGPEQPLVDGFVDFLQEKFPDLSIVGPNKKAATLEGSKSFAKKFMLKYNIPTAEFKSFSYNQIVQAKDFIKSLNPPYVIKADGLAAGKGVIIAHTVQQAYKVIDEMFAGKFGQASKTIVIERFLDGIEFSVFIITNGKTYKILPVAKDYKKVGEGDTGPNTGGMGAISPVPFQNKILKKVENQIIIPTLEGLLNEGIIYKGFLYFGLINVNDQPYVLEYNVRLGDPEAQVILPLIESNFAELLLTVNSDSFDTFQLKLKNKSALGVVLASEGYPLGYQKGKKITFPQHLPDNQLIFFAGVKKENDFLITNGGRVLTAVGIADTLSEAKSLAYDLVSQIHFENKYYRKDIGYEFLKS